MKFKAFPWTYSINKEKYLPMHTASDDIMKNGNNSTKSQIPSGLGSGNSGGKIPRFTKSDHDALAEIFRKIGQKELTKQGLQELYNFKQENPHADLEPFLIKSSEYFRNYIGMMYSNTIRNFAHF